MHNSEGKKWNNSEPLQERKGKEITTSLPGGATHGFQFIASVEVMSMFSGCIDQKAEIDQK